MLYGEVMTPPTYTRCAADDVAAHLFPTLGAERSIPMSRW